MWTILEHHDIGKIFRKLPVQVQKNYEYWKSLVFANGPDMLKHFPGLHDEKLSGKRIGQRSSRLSRQYRVIYKVERKEIVVFVIGITPHHY